MRSIKKFEAVLVTLSIWTALVPCAPVARAALSPVALSIFPPVQFPPEDVTIGGARLGVIWAKHRSMYGLDLGLIGTVTTQHFGGVSVAGLFNRTYGVTTAFPFQIAGLTNFNTGKTRIYGIQATLGFNRNSAESTIIGLQVAPFANLSPHTTNVGLQVGIYNQSREVYGFQIGLISRR